MAGQADGSIIIDTELNSDGFKAGSAELLAAIKSLSEEVKNLGTTLKEIFNKPLTPTVNTSGAEEQVDALEAKVQELEASLEELRNTGNTTGPATTETPTPQVNMGGTTQKASDLQKQIDAVNTSVERLEPTFQRAMSGSESAMTSFEGKASALEDKIAELQEKLETVGQTKYPTQEYEELSAQVSKAEQALFRLYDRQDKMSATGVKENSRQWQSLQYDIQNAEEALNRLEAAKTRMETSGTAFTMGADTSQYAQMEATLARANARLQEMQSSTQQTEGFMSRLASSARAVASFIGKAAASAAGGLVSAVKSAASHMASLLTHSKSTKNQFSGLISSAKKFTLSLLGARGVYALLRKAVSAYMAENQQLANTLSSCWSGIGNLLGPIITRLINLVAQAVAYVTSFLKLFGLYGSSAQKAITSAGGAAAKETKELKRQLASFDELNILSDDSSDSGGGGGGSSADAAAALPEVTLPDWAKLMVDQLKAGDWAAAATTLATKLNEMVANVDWAGIGNKIGYYLNGALTFLATFIKTFDWLGLGSNLATGVNSILNSVDWGNLGTLFSAKFRIIIMTLGGFLTNLDWGALAKGFSDFAINFFDGITEAIAAVDWQQIGRNVATFIETVDWGGVASSLFRALGTALGALGDFLRGLLEDAWDAGVEWWKETAGEDGEMTIGEFLNGILEALANIGEWVMTNIIDPFMNALVGEDNWAGMKDAGKDIIEGLYNGICEFFADPIGWIREHIVDPFINGFKSLFGIASPSTVMEEQGNFIVQGLLQGITGAWSSITEFFSGALSGIGNAISTAWSNVKEWTSTAWSNVKSTVGGAWESIKSTTSSVCSSVASKASEAYGNVKSYISDKLTSAKNAASNAWDSMKSTASSIGSSIASKVSDTYTDVKDYITDKLTSAKETAGDAWDNMKSTVSSVGSTIASKASSYFSQMKSSIVEKVNSAKSTATTGWNNMKTAITTAASNMHSTVSTKFAGIYSTITGKISSVTSVIQTGFESARSNIVSKMSSAMNTIQNQGWYSVGSNICSGIANGINAGWTWLKNTVGNLASNLLNAAKSALGIRSPSTLFRDEVGKYIGLGIGEGVTDSEPDVLKSVSGVADAIADEFAANSYTISPINVDSNGAIPRALDSFSDKITNSFTSMLDQLRAIAERVTFTMPAVAGSAIPYSLKTTDTTSNSQISGAIEASNNELGSIVIQSVTNATAAIVRAIQDYSGTTVNLDIDSITQGVIDEINRKARMTGKSPLLV